MMSSMKVAQGRLTYSELRLLPDNGNRYELVDGDLYVGGEKVSVDFILDAAERPATPSPNEKHQRVSSRLSVSLYLHVEANGLGRIYYAPFDVVFTEKIALQPDIVFVSKSRLHIIGPEYILGPPDLVVEILSPFRAKFDRVTKFEKYAEHGVGEYWIIDPIAETVEIFRLAGDRYELSAAVSGEQLLTSPLFPGWRLAAGTLFAE